NPWAWKKIYEANRETIKDPHWIFPEQQFVIPEIAEQVSPKTETAVISTEPTSVPADYKFDGKIVRAEKGQLIIVQGDLVYLDIGLQHGVTKDTKCYVFRKKGSIRDSRTGKLIGYSAAKLGILQLTEEITDKTSTAIVYRSYEPISRGDYVKIIK
ncbi:MAG: LysM peptidoglycan-binding domain-containing protein, partial [Elusimicrobiota bacterium]|nr:LysM peptidoglycan-binding domain-containing protein [Elusimicrobiota bacterium]